MKNLSDGQLLVKLRNGSLRAFDELYRRYSTAVLNFVRKLIKDQMRAEDITQDIFMRLYVRRKVLDPALSVKNWLFVCARNASMDVLRSKRATDVEKTGDLPEALKERLYDVPSADLPEDGDALSDMRAAMARLPERRAQVLKMSKLDEMSSRDIAERMGISARTVEKHLELAMKDLKAGKPS